MDKALKHILLIEDNMGVADALVLLLDEEGYRVNVWVQGTKVNLHAPYPDLILLDLLLGGMDGKLICQELKSREATRHIPVILMSANKNIPRIAKEVNADDWIMKPFEMWNLLVLLDSYIGAASV